MRIETASLHPYEATLARPYVSATAEHATRQGLILRVTTEDGTEGLGEAAPLSNRTETLQAARDALVHATDALASTHLTVPDALGEVDAFLPDAAGTPTARFALELALLDLAARHGDRPLCQHLATEHVTGKRRPPASVPVNATIPVCSLDETAQRAEAAELAGFSTIKLKATGAFEDDLDRVATARAAAGPDVRLRLDVNGAWPDLETARERMHTLAEHDLEYVEQPLPPDATDAMARLRATSPIPVAADEPVLDLESARGIVQAEAADVLVLKPMVLGGPLAAIGIARMAEAHDVPTVVTSTIDGAIGRAGALHTAAALGERSLACGLATGSLIEHEPAAYDERIEDGRLAVPGAPGHGAWLMEPLEEAT